MDQALFISLDGVDGSGKSTQCRLLAQWLRAQGRAVTECGDPGSTPMGQRIRELLLDSSTSLTLTCETFLFMASRAQLTAEVIRPELTAGHVVISDRFLLANVVYQGHAGGIDPDMLWTIGRLATDGLEPDLTVVLDLPLELAIARRRRPADRMESRGAAYQAGVRAGFRTEAERNPDRIRLVDASQPIEVVHQQICDEVTRLRR
jgi:dTMP kinase